jgi:hypothetical protein
MTRPETAVQPSGVLGLPFTGAELARYLTIALVLLVGGVGAVFVGRRREM